MIMLIMFSVVTIVFEQKEKKGTSPCASGDGWVSGMEWFACTVFTAEIVARFAITNSARTLIRDPYMWFDILAVLPCWLIPTASLIPGGTALCGGLSHLKSLRMFRLLKLARKYEGSIVIVRAMKLSLPALTVAIFFLMISVTVFATFLFFTESLNREGAYRSIPHAMWFMMVTMTTVGYGDVSPLTDGGKVVTTMAMLFGVLFLAMPLAIVGNNFVTVCSQRLIPSPTAIPDLKQPNP